MRKSRFGSSLGKCKGASFRYFAVETAFTVTFGRSGEDNKKFKLGNVEQTLQGFAGADYQLQVFFQYSDPL